MLIATFQNCSNINGITTNNTDSNNKLFDNPLQPTVVPEPSPTPKPPLDARGKLQKFKEDYPASWLEMYSTFIFKTPDQLSDASFANDSFVPPSNINTGKKRMLIIGDSISLCYTPSVRQLLSGKFEVHRVPHNGASTELGLKSVDKYLEAGPWDLITVNWGLHDLTYFADKPQKNKTLIADYKTRLETILLPKLGSSGAKLIWMRITQTNNHPLHRPGDIDEYNSVADAAALSRKILTLDLLAGNNAVEHLPDNLHFTQSTCNGFGKRIEEKVLTLFP